MASAVAILQSELSGMVVVLEADAGSLVHLTVASRHACDLEEKASRAPEVQIQH